MAIEESYKLGIFKKNFNPNKTAATTGEKTRSGSPSSSVIVLRFCFLTIDEHNILYFSVGFRLTSSHQVGRSLIKLNINL